MEIDLNDNFNITDIIQKAIDNNQITAKRWKTGFLNLDIALDGGLEKEIYLVNGATGTGKSTFLQQLAEQIVTNEKNENTIVLYFNIEMPSLRLIERGASRLTNTPISSLIGEKYEKGVWTHIDEQTKIEKLKTYENAFKNKLFFIGIDARLNMVGAEECALNTAEIIKDVVEGVQATRPLHENIIVCIDYLQILSSTDKLVDKIEKYKNDMFVFKQLQEKTNAPILIISSMSRDVTREIEKSGSNKLSSSTTLSRGSADTDFTAGYLFNLLKEDKNKMSLTIAKARGASGGGKTLYFDTNFKYQKFENCKTFEEQAKSLHTNFNNKSKGE